jgi:2-methylcitrate dehydratase PrpD
MKDVTTELARFAMTATPAASALEMMRLSLFDWAACAIAGGSEPVSVLLRRKAIAEAGTGKATLIGGGRVPASVAALVNGATSHALDYDDTHFGHIGHPSVAVLPAVLALAERDGMGPSAMLNSALIGVEGSIRFGQWLGRPHYQIGFHQTATAGAVGATLAAIRLLGLTEDVARNALGLAATRASGLKSQFGTMGKPYNAGLAAETGVEAALLAGLGMTSAADGLGGPQGLGPTHHGVADEAAFDDIGQSWRFEAISHKFHACCHGLHAMLEALSGTEIEVGAIEAVIVATHPRWLTVCNTPAPRTGLEAKFSYRLTAAMALLGVDTGSIDTFADKMVADPVLTEMRDRVQVIGSEALSETQARVTLRLRSGEVLEYGHDLDAPISMLERRAKLRRKAASLLSDDRAASLWQAVNEDSLDPLLRELAAPLH